MDSGRVLHGVPSRFVLDSGCFYCYNVSNKSITFKAGEKDGIYTY